MRGPARSPPRAAGNAPASNPREYWGSLINDQHPPQASPLFRRLLHAIVVYVNEHLEPTDTHELTPQKLSSFYRSVGGEGLDELFLHTSFQRLSQIYTALGCVHSLQPVANDFKPPAIPALTTRGFIIWQTVQLLMDPTEHRPYIQNAVRKFPLRDPETQQLFPRDLIPDSCFPRVANQETVSWHEDVSRKLFAEPDVGESAAGDVSEAEPVRMPPPQQQDRYGRRRSRPASRKPSRQHTPVESDYDTAEDWGYGTATPHRNTRTHHHPRPEVYAVPTAAAAAAAAAAAGAYSRSAPGGAGEEYAHHHRAYPDIKVATPVTSDLEEEYDYRPSRRSRKHKTSSRRPSTSRSRQRGAAGYAVYSNGEQVPISYPAATAKSAGVGVGVGPDGYLRPAVRLHAYQSFPDLAGGYVGGGGGGGMDGYGRGKEEDRRRRSTSSGRRRKEYYEDEVYDSDDGLAGEYGGGQWVGRRSAGAGRHGGGGGGRRVPKAYY